MEREFNKKNLREIQRMIVEIAKGNFAFKIPRTNYNDAIEGLSVQLNMMAEELRENLSHISYVNPQKTYQHIHHTSFLLDDSFLITGCTTGAINLLEREEEEIIGQPFDSFLAGDSVEDWKKIQQVINTGGLPSSSYQLEYLTGNNLLVPARCFVSEFNLDNAISKSWIITFFSTVLQKNDSRKLRENGIKEKMMSKWDIKAIQNIHDYISHNFTKPLLSNLQLAHLFGINEHKLKNGFKVLFGTTPFKYYNELRMQEAKALIKNTNNSMELISFNLGFQSYPHFSKAFKKKFGYSPRQFKKSSNKNGDDK